MLIAGFGAWATLSQLEGAVVAQGHVVVSGERQTVQHPDGGVVAKIGVTESQAVKEGDILVQIDGRSLMNELSIVEGKLFELNSRKARLEAEAMEQKEITFSIVTNVDDISKKKILELESTQKYLFKTREQSMDEERAQFEKQRAQIAEQQIGLKAQRAALEEQSNLAGQELVKQQKLLSQGLTQSARVTQLLKEASQLKGQIGGVVAEAAQAQQRAEEISLQVIRSATARREEASTQLGDLLPQENELTARRQDLQERIERLVVRAPTSGIVMGLMVTTPGAVVRPADVLMSIVPQDRPLQIQLQVSPLIIDDIHDGQRVRLSFPTFHDRMMPDLWSRISSISADAFSDQKTQSSFYRADIELGSAELTAMGLHKIIPGMPVQAFIQTQSRSPFEYLTKPLKDYFQMAFKEN